jgi:hypothetical protein
MARASESTKLHEFFLTMARKSFNELGVGDETVVGYVAGLLTEFARCDRLYPLRDPNGKAIDSVVEAQIEAARSQPSQQSLTQARELRKYLGDYTLFMSGLFRTHVERTGVLDYYFEEGRRSYWAVSELDLSLYRTGFLFFQQLSKNFEYYSGALDYMRKAYFAPAPGGVSPFAEFLRQVEGWMTTGLSEN